MHLAVFIKCIHLGNLHQAAHSSKRGSASYSLALGLEYLLFLTLSNKHATLVCQLNGVHLRGNEFQNNIWLAKILHRPHDNILLMAHIIKGWNILFRIHTYVFLCCVEWAHLQFRHHSSIDFKCAHHVITSPTINKMLWVLFEARRTPLRPQKKPLKKLFYIVV